MKYFNVYFVRVDNTYNADAMENETQSLVNDLNSWSLDGDFTFKTASVGSQSGDREEWAQNVASAVDASNPLNSSDIIVADYSAETWGYGFKETVNVDSYTTGVEVAAVYGGYAVPQIETRLFVRHEVGHVFATNDDENVPWNDGHGFASADYDSGQSSLINITPMAAGYALGADDDPYTTQQGTRGDLYPDEFINGEENYQGTASTWGAYDGVFVMDYSYHMRTEIDRWVNRYAQ